MLSSYIVRRPQNFAKSPLLFVLFTASQIIDGDFQNFCGLLRIYELYKKFLKNPESANIHITYEDSSYVICIMKIDNKIRYFARNLPKLWSFCVSIAHKEF